MTKDPNFVSVRLPDDVAIWLREYATANKLIRADKPNMGGSIIAIVRSVKSGQTISNNVGQSSAVADVDIDRKIDEAIASKISEMRNEINDLKSTVNTVTKDFARYRDIEIDDLTARVVALENNHREATAPAKKAVDAVSTGESAISVEPETLPIIEAIENIAAPMVEKSFDEMLQVLAIQKTEIKALSGAQNQTQFDYVKQRIFEQTGEIWEWEGAPKDGKWVRVNNPTIAAPSIEKSLNGKGLSDTIAATTKPKSTKRSAKSKAILTRPEALAIAQSFNPKVTGQNLYDWAKAALTAKSDESRLANSQKLAAVGLVAVLSPENKPVWQAKT